MTRPYRYVIRALPTDYRREHGDELVETALELRDGKWSARESVLLFTHGLRTRARTATKGSPQTALAQAIISTIELLLIGWVATLVRFLVTVDRGPFATFEVAIWMIPLVLVATAALLINRPRILIVVSTVLTFAMVFGVRWPSPNGDEFALAAIGQAVVLGLSGVWAVRRAPVRTHPGRAVVLLACLSIVGVVGNTASIGMWIGSGFFIAMLAGLLLAHWDPRLLLIAACFVVWNRVVALPFLVIQPPQGLDILWASLSLGVPIVVVVGGSVHGLRRLKAAI